MKLTWHIVKKDARRMALPVMFWLTFILGGGLWLLWTSPDIIGHAGSEISAWVSMATMWTRLLVGLQFVIGYLLAGALVLEDAPAEMRGFGQTRPIGNTRLLAAKLCSATLLFVVAPAVVLAPVWLRSGMSWHEMMLATSEWAIWNGSVAFMALAVASLARTLAQFLVFTVVLFGMYTFCAVIDGVPPFHQEASAGVWRSRTFLVQTAVYPVMLGALVLQFLTRKTARTWVFLGVALFVCAGIRLTWPWDFSSAIRSREARGRFLERPEDRAANIAVSPTFTALSRSAKGMPSMKVVTPWSRGQFYAPTVATRPDGSVVSTPFANWGEAACLRAIGLDAGDGPLTWQFGFLFDGPGKPPPDNPRFSGTLEIWAAGARVLGEVPLRVSAEIAGGSTRLRITAINRGDGERLDEIFIEERERGPANFVQGDDRRNLFRNMSYVDRYVLVSRTANQAQLLSVAERGAVQLRAQRLVFRRLFVYGTEAWRDGVLVKVRIEKDHRFERPIEVQGVTFLREEANP